MRLFILIVLVLALCSLYFSGDRFILLVMELTNYCQDDKDCLVFTDAAMAPCGRYIHRSEKRKMEQVLSFIKRINPRFRTRSGRNCRHRDPVRNRPICHYGKCIAEEAKWDPVGR